RIQSVYQRMSTSKAVLVLPANTFRVTGRVRDEGLSLASARVQVTAGLSAGLSTTTNDFGVYYLYGVRDDIQVQVSKDGYQTQSNSFTVGDNITVDFNLTPSAPRVQVEGNYRLTLTAAPECAAELSEEARSRSYDAAVTQVGPLLTVRLS